MRRQLRVEQLTPELFKKIRDQGWVLRGSTPEVVVDGELVYAYWGRKARGPLLCWVTESGSIGWVDAFGEWAKLKRSHMRRVTLKEVANREVCRRA